MFVLGLGGGLRIEDEAAGSPELWRGSRESSERTLTLSRRHGAAKNGRRDRVSGGEVSPESLMVEEGEERGSSVGMEIQQKG